MTTPEHLEQAARAAFLAGKRDESAADWASAHHQHRHVGDARGAARCAFWLGFCFLLGGEVSLAQGWLARAQRLLDEQAGDCPERGYLLVPEALARLAASDAEGAYRLFEEAAELGERLGDVDLTTLGGLGRAQAAIALGRTDVAVRSLDEVMVAVTADEVSPIVAGLVHCAAIEACQQMFDLRRAQEWTAALSHWCDAQPGLVQYRGQCLVHRSEILQLRGAWSDALDEARHACVRLSAEPAAGAALYQLGELQRLRGQFAEAEEAYRAASLRGRSPQPGMARLRLAQGQVDVALASIRRTIDEADDATSRSTMLAAYVEIAVAADDVPAARAAADDLASIAEGLHAPLLDAMSAHAAGAVLVGERASRRALSELRRAWTLWRSLDAPYHAAQVRVLVGLACRALGDEDGAEMEFDAARTVFQQLGAAPDLAAVDALSEAETVTASDGLTAREVEVLALVATGRTNRAIAAELVISEKTVARHLSNIFTKLGLSSRAAATAYAYEHGVMTSSA